MEVPLVTIADVARAAGVSKSAVSKVLLGGGGKTTVVGKQTALRVRQAAEELNYRPNRVAQQLASKRNDIIGVIIDSQCCSLYNNIMATIEHETFRAGRRLQVGLVHDNFQAIEQYVGDLLGYGIQNVICLAHYYDFAEQVPPLFAEFRNVLFINPPMSEVPQSFVSPDYYGNFRLLVDHLISLGHRRILYAKTAYDTPDCRQRVQALRDALAQADLPFEEAFVYGQALGEIDSQTLMNRFLDDVLPLKPDALILGNATAIAWAFKLLPQRGLRIPEDIAIAGMDAWPASQAQTPAITVIDNNFKAIAECAVAVICAGIEAESPALIQKYIPGTLLRGESCGETLARVCGARQG